MRKVAWVVTNLCETTNPPVADYVLMSLLPILNQFIKNNDFSVI